ncbi:MAG: hypothetical protein AB1742_10265, partial [bacterium]
EIGKEKNFKLRALYMGDQSMALTPLTIFGSDMTGFTGQFLLNDYTIMFGLGTRSGGWDPGLNDRTFMYGLGLDFPIPGKSSSKVQLARFTSYQDDDFTSGDFYQESCGSGISLGEWSGSYVCDPPERNAVTGLFVIYPVAPGIFMKGEYAHSAYYRDAFNMMYDEGEVDFSITKKYQAMTGWRPVPKIADQDDAFFLSFDYNRGPISISFLGYAHLGSKFASRYFGLPGFSMSSLGLSVIPIQIQGIDLFFIYGNYNKIENHYKWEFAAAKIEENEPMYLDWSQMSSPMPVNIFDMINNRTNDGRIKALFHQNKLHYYMTDKITLTGEYLWAKGKLGPDCLDADLVNVVDDAGNTLDLIIGDGVADCSDPAGDDRPLALNFSQKSTNFNLFWRTSKKAEYSVDYKISETLIGLNFGTGGTADTASQLIYELADTGTDFEINHKLKYRLTDISTIELWYNTRYDRDPVYAKQKSLNREYYGFSFSMDY